MVWLRQSAAHNWPVTSTQQNSIHAQTGQESTRPLGNIQIFINSLCLLQKQLKKAYSRLFTNNILGYGEGRGGLAWRWVCGVRADAVAQKVPGWALSPGSRFCKALDSATGKGFNSFCEETSFCCLWAREDNSKNIK